MKNKGLRLFPIFNLMTTSFASCWLYCLFSVPCLQLYFKLSPHWWTMQTHQHHKHAGKLKTAHKCDSKLRQ